MVATQTFFMFTSVLGKISNLTCAYFSNGLAKNHQPVLTFGGQFELRICQVFKKKSGDFLRYLRNSAKDPNGPGRIWTAGEAENAFRKKRTAEGKGGGSCRMEILGSPLGIFGYLKMDGWNTILSFFGFWPIFRCHVTFKGVYMEK